MTTQLARVIGRLDRLKLERNGSGRAAKRTSPRHGPHVSDSTGPRRKYPPTPGTHVRRREHG
eukprot:3260666-Pyramimonas_sp.AAC.1